MERAQGSFLSRWLRTTFDYNPTFPLTALALLAGLRMLAGESSVSDAASGILGASGVLQAYELLLLGVALAVLWPRKVAYETTSILIILAVFRFAAPFLAIRLAGEGRLGAAIGLGAAIAVLMLGKTAAVQRQLRLDWLRWERTLDAVLFCLGAVALPLLAERLAAETGAGITHATSRLIQLGAWWTLALLIAPLACGPEGLGAEGPLRSRRFALVWRPITAAGLTLLLLNALWVSGGWPTPAALIPLALGGVAIASHLIRAWGGRTPWLARYAPAGALALALLSSSGWLLGTYRPLSHAAAVVGLFVLAALAVPLIDRRIWRPGARALAWVAAFAPLRFVSSGKEALLYLSVVSACALMTALWRRADRPAAVALASLGVLILIQVGARHPIEAFVPVALLGGAAALLLAWRLPAGEHAPRVAQGLALIPVALQALIGPPAWAPLGGLLLATSLAGGAAWRRGEASRWVALVAGGGLLGRKVADGVSPGLLLVAASFAGIPLGTLIGLRRERLAREESEALLADPRFEDPALVEPAPFAEPAPVAEEVLA
ncbi:MAG TPA: hypothetical protein DEA08_24885 [Planctomycetes bacterium]|nr:hypothetical protein [Planctomycetota bacterium]